MPQTGHRPPPIRHHVAPIATRGEHHASHDGEVDACACCPKRNGPDECRGANRMNIQHVPIRSRTRSV